MDATQAQLPNFSRRILSGGGEYLVSVDLMWIDLDTIMLNRVITPTPIRRKGFATRCMKELTNYSDLHNLTIVLTINAYGDMSKTALDKWYRRLGFELPDKMTGLYVRKSQ